MGARPQRFVVPVVLGRLQCDASKTPLPELRVCHMRMLMGFCMTSLQKRVLRGVLVPAERDTVVCQARARV